MTIKIIKLEEAIGAVLAHDVTEICPGEFKGPAFVKGHRVCEADLCHLQRLGKNHLYIIDLAEDEIHENEAAAILPTPYPEKGSFGKTGPAKAR